MSRQSSEYIECMALKLTACASGTCPDGSVCTYQQCWEQADAACYASQVSPAPVPGTLPSLPPPPTPVPETQTNLDVIGLIYTAAQAAAGVLAPGAVPTDIKPSAIPAQLPTELFPALQQTLPMLNAAGLDPGAVLQDLLGYHAAVQNKKLTGDSSSVTWADINKGLASTPPETTPASTDLAQEEAKPKKSNTAWYVAGAVVLGGVVLWLARSPGRRDNPSVSWYVSTPGATKKFRWFDSLDEAHNYALDYRDATGRNDWKIWQYEPVIRRSGGRSYSGPYTLVDSGEED